MRWKIRFAIGSPPLNPCLWTPSPSFLRLPLTNCDRCPRVSELKTAQQQPMKKNSSSWRKTVHQLMFAAGLICGSVLFAGKMAAQEVLAQPPQYSITPPAAAQQPEGQM